MERHEITTQARRDFTSPPLKRVFCEGDTVSQRGTPEAFLTVLLSPVKTQPRRFHRVVRDILMSFCMEHLPEIMPEFSMSASGIHHFPA